jgi:hypothetical protein
MQRDTADDRQDRAQDPLVAAQGLGDRPSRPSRIQSDTAWSTV